MSRLVPCSCGKLIDTSTTSCPHCGRTFYSKGWIHLLQIGAVLLGIVVILLLAFVYELARSKEEYAPVIPAAHQLQSEAVVSGMKVHLHVVERRSTIGSGQFIAKGEFLVVETEMTNISETYQVADYYDFMLVDPKGKEFEPNKEATEAYQKEAGLPGDALQNRLLPKGEQVKTRIVYEIPANTSVVMRYGSVINAEVVYMRME